MKNTPLKIVKTSIAIGLAFEILLLAGCASLQPKTDEEQVAIRAQERQDALIVGDYKSAYKFFSPGYRETHTLEHYIGKKGGAVKRESASIRSVECEENLCAVAIDLYYRYQGIIGINIKPSATPNHRVNKEKWIKVGNRWWLYAKK